jgi:hypothetical protein
MIDPQELDLDAEIAIRRELFLVFRADCPVAGSRNIKELVRGTRDGVPDIVHRSAAFDATDSHDIAHQETTSSGGAQISPLPSSSASSNKPLGLNWR